VEECGSVKHSSLLRYGIRYDRKKFIILALGGVKQWKEEILSLLTLPPAILVNHFKLKKKCFFFVFLVSKENDE